MGFKENFDKFKAATWGNPSLDPIKTKVNGIYTPYKELCQIFIVILIAMIIPIAWQTKVCINIIK